MIHIPERYQTLVECLAIFVLSSALFLWGVAGQEVVSFDSRFYLFALEMWRHGMSWFPTTYLEPYPDYPGLSTWIIILFSQLFGGLDKFTAVLPTALTASAVVVMTYGIGALQCKRWGLYAAGLLLFTLGFLQSAHAISLDMYVTLLTTVSFYALYSETVRHAHQRHYWTYVCCVLGFMFRGPLGFIIPAGVTFTYWLVQKSYKKLLVFTVISAILLVVCITALLWLAYQVGGEHFANDVLRMQVLGRLGDSDIPIYYYFIESLTAYAIAYPLAMLVLFGMLAKDYRRPPHTTQQQFLFQLAGWIAVIIIGMSLPGDKKIRYVLPMVPALALMAAYPLANRQTHRYFFWLRRVVLFMLFCLPMVIAAIIFYCQQTMMFQQYLAGLPLTAIRNSLLVLQLIAVGSLFSHDLQRRVAILFAAALLSFLLVYHYIAMPVQLTLESGREVVQATEELRHKADVRLAFYKMGQDGLPVKYMINMPGEEKPLFFYTEDELFAYKAPVMIVAEENRFNDLARNRAALFDVLLKGKIGHVEVVVFRSKRRL